MNKKPLLQVAGTAVCGLALLFSASVVDATEQIRHYYDSTSRRIITVVPIGNHGRDFYWFDNHRNSGTVVEWPSSVEYDPLNPNKRRPNNGWIDDERDCE